MQKQIKNAQIEAIKKIREQFADEVFWLLEDWIDALDKASTENGLPSEPIMRERARIFKAQELAGLEADYEEEGDNDKEPRNADDKS